MFFEYKRTECEKIMHKAKLRQKLVHETSLLVPLSCLATMIDEMRSGTAITRISVSHHS
jgi:hypothetical protein